MPKVGIIATVEAEPGRRDEVLSVLMAHRARCLKDEPGTLQFEIMVPQGEDSKLLVFEVYRDEAAHEAHRNAPSILLWRKERAGMIAKIVATHGSVVT